MSPRSRRPTLLPVVMLAAALMATLLPAPALAAPPDDALEERLQQSWRWRAVPPDTTPSLLREVRTAPDGGVVSSHERSLLAFDGWSWKTIPLGRDGILPNVVAAYPRDGRWIVFHHQGVISIPDPVESDELPPVTRVLHDGRGGPRTCLPVETPDGRILNWSEGRVVEYGAVGARPIHAGPDTEAPVRALLWSDRGRLLAVTDESFWEHDGVAWTHVAGGRLWPEGTAITRVVQGAGDRIYLLPFALEQSRPGWYWEGGALHRMPAPDDGVVRVVHDACATAEGELVVAMRPGWLSVFRDGAWREAGPVPPMGSGEFVRSICVTTEGRLVLLTASSRLYGCDLRSRRWRAHGPAQGHTDVANVSALEPDGSGGLWVGLHEGVAHWDGERFDRIFTETGPDGPSLRAITGLAVDGRGHVWAGSGSAGTFNGPVEFDGERWTHHRAPADIGRFPVHGIRRIGDELWFTLLGTSPDVRRAGGLVLRSGDGWRRFTVDDGLPSDRCYDVARAADGALWVATLGGLARRVGERFEAVTDPGAPRGRVFALYPARDGALWVGRGLIEVGVAVLRDGRWSHPRPLDNMPSAAAAFCEDKDGRIYFASDTGLYRVDGQVFEDLSRLTESPYSTFWPLRSDGAGGLWLGSRGDGVVHYVPDDTVPPRILRPRLQPHPEDQALVVKWRASDYWGETPAEHLRFAIQVDDDEWDSITDVDQHTLRGLSPGPHAVRLRASDAVGNVGTMDTPVRARIPDHWARGTALKVSGLFAVMALAVLGATWMLRQRERRREQERLEAVTNEFVATHEEERQFISEELHDELGQLLTAVSLDLQLADRLDDADRRGDALQRALSTSREALERTRELSSRLRPRLLDELGLDQALREALSEFERRTGAVVETDIALGEDEVPERLRGQLYRIVQESLSRVARADVPGRVTLRMRRRDTFIEMDLYDDGPAWKHEDGRHAGEIVRQRVRLLEGRLTLDSGPDGQNHLFLSVPGHEERYR